MGNVNLHAGSVVVKPVTWRSRFLYVHTHARVTVVESVAEIWERPGLRVLANHFLKRVSAKHVPRIRVEREKGVRHQ